jgi:hypothetical protein
MSKLQTAFDCHSSETEAAAADKIDRGTNPVAADAAAAGGVGGPAAAPSPFKLDEMKLDQNFIETAGVRKMLATVPLRKPNPQDFFRVHPSPDYRAALATLDLKDDREIFIVAPNVAREMPGEFATTEVFTAINRQGVVFLWPVKLTGKDGRTNEWNQSAAEIAKAAMTQWVRMRANMSLGAYDHWVAESVVIEPEWPSLSFEQLINIACKAGRYIQDFDHPAIKRLRGLV